MEKSSAAPIQRLARRGLSVALGDPQRVLVAFIALTLIVVAGFTRFNVDTEPGLLVDDGAAFDDSLTVVFVGERSLMTAPILAAISSLHRNARQIDGVEGADVISVASLMGSSVPTDRLSVREFAASTGNDALAGVVVSADRLALTMVVPLKSTADPGSIRIELEGLISADSELSALRHEVAGVVLARQRTVDHLYGQAVARTVLGWGLGFLVLLVVFSSATDRVRRFCADWSHGGMGDGDHRGVRCNHPGTGLDSSGGSCRRGYRPCGPASSQPRTFTARSVRRRAAFWVKFPSRGHGPP